MYENRGLCGSDDFKTEPEIEKYRWTGDNGRLRTVYCRAHHALAPKPQALPVVKLGLMVARSHGCWCPFRQSTVASLLHH